MQISLNGIDWLFKGFIGEDWLWRNAHKPGASQPRGWQTGRVPGSVMHDLWQSGQIPDPYFEQNSLLAEWAPQRTWVYKKSFPIGEELLGKRIRLVFEGVDYEARFFLNGEPLGEHRGMYTPAVFEVGDLLHYGQENLLAVVIDPAPFEQPQVGYSSRVRTHKSRMTYWWDFCPRLVHQGIWDAVYLDVTGPARLEGVWVRPQLSAGLDRAEVQVSVDLSARWPAHQPPGFPAQAGAGSRGFKAFPVEVEVVVELRYGDRLVASQQAQCDISYGGGRLNLKFDLDAPRLWWPNGHGEQALYEAVVRVMDPLQRFLLPLPGRSEPFESDRRRVTFGIRSLELVPNEDAPPDALPYTLRVNGRRIYAKGWNWVPLDVMYGVERPEKLERLLGLAQRAHVNMLRVWGGGLIEKEAFYDLCDRLGILVWQEFIQSSSGIENSPPEDPEFIRELVAQAEQLIPRSRNHPSLALWCGGNELMSAPDTPADDTHPMLSALRTAVARLDPGRPWLPTSPSGPVFGNSLESLARHPSRLHDVHGPWEHQGLSAQYELYNRGSSLLHSEFGVEGITNRKALDAVISPGRQWPVSLDNPVWEHLGAWWVKEARWRELFGPVEDLDALLQAAQFAQASGLGYAVEADRRRKYHNSGTLPWQFNEPYPMAACTSAVDYFARPKPAYYAVAQAYAPLHLSARFPTIAWAGRETFEAEIWLSNSGPSTQVDDVRRLLDNFSAEARTGERHWLQPSSRDFKRYDLVASLTSPRGRVHTSLRQPASLPSNAAACLAEIHFPLASIEDELFFLDMQLESPGGPPLAQNRYLFSRLQDLSPMFRIPGTRLQVRSHALDSVMQVEITNTGEWAALLVWLEDARPVTATGFAYFDANYFCLLPGESRSVHVEWKDVPPEEQHLTIIAWNTSAYELPE